MRRWVRFAAAGLALALVLAARPVLAQVDFSGEWAPRFHEDQPERVPGPELGDYLGLPINEAARLRADNWEASIQTLPEWQCRPHSADYIWRGPSQLTIRKDEDPLTREIVAFHAEWLRSIDNPIYLDGRPHPSPDALHSWGGFATGKWQGDMLTVTVTHLKEGYVRRNGLPRSDRATVTEHLDAPRRLSHGCDHRQRPGVSHRAVHPQHRLRAGPAPARPPIHARWSPKSSGRGSGSTPSARHNTQVQEFSSASDSVRGHAWWR
jgi:hypothetical protein